MAAESREGWTVVLRFDDWDEAKACSTRPNADEPVRYVEYFCPHCSKPWPMGDVVYVGQPLRPSQYANLVRVEYGRQYCCEATRRDCEEING